MDLFTAGLSELAVSGGLIGPTFACIIARQFHNLRRGDRYWYENNLSVGAFTPGKRRLKDTFLGFRQIFLWFAVIAICGSIIDVGTYNAVHLFSVQLAELRKVSLARVLCDNTDSFAIQRRVMVEPIPFMNM